MKFAGENGLTRKSELLSSEIICGKWLNADSCKALSIFQVLGASVPEQYLQGFATTEGKLVAVFTFAAAIQKWVGDEVKRNYNHFT